MPEHVKAVSNADYILNIEYPLWLQGEESSKLGLMYDIESNKLDIFGWILKECGYKVKDFKGLRVPSQFAQTSARSGRTLNGMAAHLCTTTHTDTEFAVSLGKANDNTTLDIFEREAKIAEILNKKKIGVWFIAEQPKLDKYENTISSAVSIFKQMISWTNMKQVSDMCNTLREAGFAIYYTETTTSGPRKYVVALAFSNSFSLELVATDFIGYGNLIGMSNSTILTSGLSSVMDKIKTCGDEQIVSVAIKDALGINIPSQITLSPNVNPSDFIPSEINDNASEDSGDCDCDDCRHSRGEFMDEDDDDDDEETF